MKEDGEMQPVGPSAPEGIEHPNIYDAALGVLKDSDSDHPMSSTELIKKISASLNESRSSLIYWSILQATRVPDSRIRSRKGRGGGYFLVVPETVQLGTSLPGVVPNKERTIEKHLWPIVVDWLKANKQLKNVSSDIANLKSGGVWSNPDIVALNILEELGMFDVEVTTCEVKPSLANWRYFFFEAVSHKRFSERVYFVYRSASGTDSAQRDEILRYAEKYGVGVIEIQIGDEDYEGLAQWKKRTDLEKTKVLEEFVELVPAPFEAISVRDKLDLLKRLGIKTKSDLYTFGDKQEK